MPIPIAERYREQQFLTATPGRLVVLTFDEILAALARARVGATTRNRELTMRAVYQARELLGDLLATLDREQGGDVAANLAAIYLFALAQLHGIPPVNDGTAYGRVVSLLQPLRDAFETVAGGSAGRSAVA